MSISCQESQSGVWSDPQPRLSRRPADHIPRSDAADTCDTAGAPKLRARRQHHRLMLCVAGAVVVLSFLLQVRSDQRVEFRFLPGYPLPELCATRSVFHTECPGCGLTRSLVFLARGDWQSSFAAHHLGWLMALAVLAQFPYRIAALRWIKRPVLGNWFPKFFGYSLVFLLIADWLIRLLC